MEWDAVIIGGGASGLAAAVAAAEAGARTLLLEASDRVGRPILASGNGRCNFSNAHIEATAYHNAAFVEAALEAFEAGCADGDGCPNGVVAFFAARGLVWREEAEGRLYPQANKASVVLDVLRACASAAGAEMRTGARVEAVEAPLKPGGPFTVRVADGQLVHTRSVVVACGGGVARAMLPDGFAYAEPRPMLGPVATDDRFVRQLDKIRVRGAISLVRDGRTLAVETGELMFRRYGVSGIAVFNLSRLMRPGDQLRINMLPSNAPAAISAPTDEIHGNGALANAASDLASARLPGAQLPDAVFLTDRAERLRKVYGRGLTCEELLRGMVLPQVADVLCAYAGMRADAAADAQTCQALRDALCAFTLEVRGIGDESVCQVRRGGFVVDAFDPATLQARSLPGLHVTGEALDVDGPCGGFNLHWAFATGLSAGKSAAARAEGGARR